MIVRLKALADRVLENELIRRIATNAAYLFSASGIAVVVSFFQNIFATRLLGVYYLGVLGAIIKFTSVVNKLISFRMNELVVRYVGQYTEASEPRRAAAVFKLAALAEFISSFVAYGAIFLLAPLGARVFAKDISTTNWFLIYGLVVLANVVFESSTGLLQILNKFKRIAIIQVGQSIVVLALIAGVFFTQRGWRGPWEVDGVTYLADADTAFFNEAGAYSIGGCVFLEYFPTDDQVVAFQIQSRPESDCETPGRLEPRTVVGHVDSFPARIFPVLLAYMAGKFIYSLGVAGLAMVEAARKWGLGWWLTPLSVLKGQFKEIAKFAVSTNISATINLVNKDSEELWVSFFRGPLETGYYKQAMALSNLVLLPVSALPQATYPELTREVSNKNWVNVRYILRQGSRLAALYTGVAAMALVIFGRPLIALLYRPEFLPAYPALLILLVGFFVANTFYWNRTALLALGLPDFPTKVNFTAAIIKIGLAMWLVPRLGYLMSAALLAGYYIFSITINVRKTRQVLEKAEQERNEQGEAGAPIL